MQRIAIAPDLTFSRLIYGMWRLADSADTSPAAIQARLERCLEHGITTMDQADIYGSYTAEGLLGAALKASPALRDKLELVTKCGIVAPIGRFADRCGKYYDTSAAHITASVEMSLKEMSTDRLDLLLIHRPDPLMDPQETGAALDALVASGKVRAVGVSNFRPWDFTLLQSAMSTKLATNQIEIGLLTADPFTNGDLAFLQERMLPVMAWSPLGGGALFAKPHTELHDALARIGAEKGVDVSAVALAWLMHHPAKLLPIVGTNSLERISRAADAEKVVLDRETWFELYTLAIGKDVP